MVAADSKPSNFTFRIVSEPDPGARFRTLFDGHWAAYRDWFLKDGIDARQTFLAGLRAMRQSMPELVPTYETVVELAGGGDLQARFLSFYCPPAYLAGCSQAVWPGDEPLLVKDVDLTGADLDPSDL